MNFTPDTLGRPLLDLRISVTDRCDFRCSYCMPEDRYLWIEREHILSFEEIHRLAALFVARGVRKLRLTGGEPLLRADLPELVRRLRELPGSVELCLTTNGSRLADLAEELRDAGLQRINFSLDTLRPERFAALTRRDALPRVLAGLEAAERCGFSGIKLNMVVQRGVNDDELLPMAEFCRARGLRLRLIEFMDVGTRNDWNLSQVVPRKEMLERLTARHPVTTLSRERPSDPAAIFAWADGAPGDVGVISSITQTFCGDCTRARLTADGRLVTCLFARSGTDLKTPLRRGESDTELGARIDAVWRARDDRYSELRQEALRSGAGLRPEGRDHLEMITLGG